MISSKKNTVKNTIQYIYKWRVPGGAHYNYIDKASETVVTSTNDKLS